MQINKLISPQTNMEALSYQGNYLNSMSKINVRETMIIKVIPLFVCDWN